MPAISEQFGKQGRWEPVGPVTQHCAIAAEGPASIPASKSKTTVLDLKLTMTTGCYAMHLRHGCDFGHPDQ